MKKSAKKKAVVPSAKQLPAKKLKPKNVLINFNITPEQRDIVYRKAMKFTKGNVTALFILRMVHGRLQPNKIELGKIQPSTKKVKKA